MPVLSGLPGLCGKVCCQSNVSALVGFSLLSWAAFHRYQLTFIDFEGVLLCLLDLNVGFLCKIGSLGAIVCSNIPSITLSLFLLHLGSQLFQYCFALWYHLPLRFSLCGSVAVYLFFSVPVFAIILSSASLILSSASFFLAVRASIFGCISLIAFLILTCLY